MAQPQEVSRDAATISPAVLEAVKKAVRDEVGSKLCGWTNHKGRVCTATFSTNGCVCEQVAEAAIAAIAKATGE